jgi:uncharacterized protein (DUF885 family)
LKIAIRITLAVTGFLAVASVPCLLAQITSATAKAVTLEDRRKALNDVFHDYWEDFMQHDPEFASAIGDARFNDKITDYSVKAYNESLERGQNFIMRLAAIDPNGLNDQEQLGRDLLLRRLVDDQEAAQYKEWEMPVTQMGGIQDEYPQVVNQLSFKTVKDYDDWIARLHAIPHAFSQITENMSIGMEDKRTPPRFLMEKVLEQVQGIAVQKPEDSPLALPLKSFPATVPAADQDRIRTEMLAAIQKEVLPAYSRFATFLKVGYIPACRTELGISALADGAKYYQYLVRRTTTTNLTADQLHQIGLDEVKRDETEMSAIAQKLGFNDLASFRASLKANPKLKATSSESLLAAYRAYLAPMQAKLPSLFGKVPKAPFEVVAVPDYMAKTAPPAYYQGGTPDGSRPGRLFIDTYNPTDRNMYAVESIAYHEGIPGHHLQISISRELTGIPEFRKYGRYTAYSEGWGLYAERLGKEVGFYQDPYSDYGRLEADIWRAIRLVVDTGVHSKHWTRDQMVQYFHDHSNIDETSIQAEVDRYIAVPSQALAYKTGQLKILELRNRAQKALGGKFDIRAFHDEVLDAGALPLDVLETRIDTWISTQMHASAR